MKNEFTIRRSVLSFDVYNIFNLKFIMKRITFIRKLFLNMASAFAAAYLTGCEEWPEDTGFLIDSSSESQSMINTVNGMTYEFYMLNQNGEITTVFNEGEDFTFCFYITNNTGNGVCYDVGYYQPENGLFTVYDYNGKDYGSANRRYGRLALEYYMEPGWRWGVEASWIGMAYEPYDYERWIRNFPNPNIREPLPKGDYYSEFKYAFNHSCTEIDRVVGSDLLTFRINFKII